MAQYEVVDAMIAGEVDFGNGKMNKVEATLKPVDGGDPITGVLVWRRLGFPVPLAGETWEGTLENSPKGGMKLAKPRNVNEGQGGDGSSAVGSSAGRSRPTQTGRTERDATGRSIERQVALKAATELVCAAASGNAPAGSGDVLAIADKFDAWLKDETPPPDKDDGESIPF